MHKKCLQQLLVGSIVLFSLQQVFASVVVPLKMVSENDSGKEIGTVTLDRSVCGVLITPNLHDLSPGIHGFHIHEKPTCADKGMAAGGHLDPDKTGEHNGPYKQKGHLGDLPVLIVNADGTATLPTLAPRFKLSELSGHALMIHAGGDNYADSPQKLGGGGDRIACGVINK